jgi:serine/threonine protein kinase
MATLRAGDKIGKYELLHPVGEGGMGEVWVGRLRSIGGFESYVAIKVIHGRFALDKRFRDMFLDEARVSAVISHPNVVATYDLAVEGEMLYQVLEYVDGDSLAGIQAAMEERQEKMPLPVALRIAADVCAGLHAAHELTFPDGRQANIVHRDVSPQNVLLGVNGAVKLIDFGVALMQDRLAQDSQGTLKGKLRYMPPEQARGEKVDRRADVYAIGAVLYEMIAGRLPFDDRTEALYFRALIQGDPPAPLPEDVPAEVRDVVLRAMAPTPADRFATASELGEALSDATRKKPANVANFVEIHLSPRAHERRKVVRSHATKVRSEPTPDADTAISSTHGSAKVPISSTDVSAAPLAAPTERVVVTPASSGRPAHASTRTDVFGDTVPPPAEPALPEIPSLALDLDVARPNAPAPAPAARPAAASAPRAAAQPSKVTTMLEPAPRRVQAVTGTHDRGVREPLPEARDAASEKSGRAVRNALGFVVGVAVLGVALVLALPTLAKKKVVRAAAERGIELEVGHVSVGFSGIELSEVTAAGPGLPLKSATVTSMRLLRDGKVKIQGVDAKLEGPAEALPAALAKVAAGKDEVELDVNDAKVSWGGLFGAGSALDARDVRFGFVRDEGDEEPHGVVAYSPEVTLTTPYGKAGPFTVNVDESDGKRRARVVFESGKSEGPNAFVVLGGATAPTHYTVRIPKTKLSALHVPPAYLGLRAGEDPELEVSGSVQVEPEGRMKGDVKATIFGISVAESRTKTPLDLELAVRADPKKPIEITKGVASYGPLTADFGGTIERDPIAGEIRFVSKALPCSYFAGAEAKKALGVAGPLALELFGKALRVTGVVNVRGSYTFSLAKLADAKLRLDVRDTCGVTLFGN